MGSALLETVRLSMEYPGTRALDVVSLSFEAGRVSALIGRNGAGKSTLVKILSGAMKPTEGEVLLAGESVDLRSPAEARARGIATVHQELSLVPGLSVAENVLLGRFPRRRGALRAAIDWPRLFEEARRILDRMDVPLDVRAPVGTLPLAQRQMVEIARAVSSGARAVLFDEPTAGLGRAEARTLLQIVRALARDGTAVVYVTHRLGELSEIADTVTGLRDGRLAATIPASEATPERLVELMYGEEARAVDELPSAQETGRSDGRHASERATRVGGREDTGSRGIAKGSGPESSRYEAGAVLEVQGLGFGEILRDVSFTLHAGEILGIAGMLGSGRTELLTCVFGARRADRGRIVVRSDEDVRGSMTVLDAARCTPATMRALGLALVPEDRKTLGLVLGLSSLDNLCLASLDRVGRRGLLSKALQRRAALPVVRDLGIVAADLDAPVSVLSGGNQQKIVLGKWLLRAPRILLCDEPTRGIDVRAKRQVFEILRCLSLRGIASIVVSSELEELMEVCDRIVVLRQGTIAAEARPRDLSLERLFALCMAPAGA